TTTTTTTTTSTTTTTTTTTSTTTTTTQSVGGAFLEFSTGVPGNVCGASRDATNAVIKNLTCGGLNLGGGLAGVPEGPTPDGSITLFTPSCAAGGGACNAGCAGGICNLGPTSTAPAPQSTDPDCTTTNCFFGTPLPIPNPSLAQLTTCVMNTWSAPASG